MAASIYRNSSGDIYRDASGNIIMINFDACPSSGVLRTDWSASYNSGSWDLTAAKTINQTGVSPLRRFNSTVQYSNSQGNSYPRMYITFNVALVFSPSVSWVGTIYLYGYENIFQNGSVVVDANIHMNCQSGKVSPFGTYVIDSYNQNSPTGNGSMAISVSVGSSITFSAS